MAIPLVTFVQEGSAIDYTPVADVDAGVVVIQNDLVGITKRSIKANDQGALHVAGVFEFPKATGAGSAMDVGVDVYWDAVEQVAQTDSEAGANKKLGKTVLATVDADEFVRVRMSQ